MELINSKALCHSFALSLILVTYYTIGTAIFVNLSNPVETVSIPTMTIRGAGNTHKFVPPPCTSNELDIIRYQLPPDECVKNHRIDRINCSFSDATRCQEATWLQEYYRSTVADQHHNYKRQAIFVGCNKGIDAVQVLRMMSNNASFNEKTWSDTFHSHGSEIGPGLCGQEGKQLHRVADAHPIVPATLHCIEALPQTARVLQSTADKLHYDSSMVIFNAAIAGVDGKALFPGPGNPVGLEYKGLGDCSGEASHCEEIQQYKLDTYINNHVPRGPIDVVSIDVEGYDYDVLEGATESLSRIQYLEFEYHGKGSWLENKLSTAIDRLEQHGFICYWAGMGKAWRITGCWLEYFDLGFWSNVACAASTNEAMGGRLETLFQRTLAEHRNIRYDGNIDIMSTTPPPKRSKKQNNKKILLKTRS